MRKSNAFHTYGLIFVFFIAHLEISGAWGKGNYFSDYEYPEIQLLFSSKEEENQKINSKAGVRKTVLENADFSPILNSDTNSFLEPSEKQKLSNEQMLKPWMRKPYADEVSNEKPSIDEGKIRHSQDLKVSEEIQTPKNNQLKEIIPSESEESRVLQKEGIPNNRLTNFLNSQNSESNALLTEQLRNAKLRKEIRIQSRNRIQAFGDANRRFNNHAAENNDDLSSYLSDIDKDIEPKEELNNVNEKLESGSRILPEYGGNNQDYEELAGLDNKNEVMALSKQPSTMADVSLARVDLMDSGNQNYVGTGEINQTIKISNINGTLPNVPMHAESTLALALNGNHGVVSTQMTLRNSMSSATESSDFSIGGDSPSTSTKAILLPVPEYKLNPNNVTSNPQTNVGVGIEDMHTENGMIVRHSNRAIPENHPLLAKPPVKISGNLMDKHSEDDNEVVLDETGTQIVKVAPMNPIVPSTTARVEGNVGQLRLFQTNRPVDARLHGTVKTMQSEENDGPPPKIKRNTNENKSVKIHETSKEQSSFQDSSKNIVDHKKPEKISDSALIDASIDLDSDEISESRKNKFMKPEYYSLSKSNPALGMVNNLMVKLRPGVSIKKKKIRGEKFNESYKRNVPSMYELGYEPSYDYKIQDTAYRTKEVKRGDPIRNYYDYENNYELDYDKENDYPRAIIHESSHSNNTALAAEREVAEYEEKRYNSHFPRKRNKLKRKRYRKAEENYRDIFAHPLSLDDPELQIVREDEDELVKRRLNHKNFATRHHREKSGVKEFPQFQKYKYAESESIPRSYLKKTNGEQALHPRHVKLQAAKEQAISENEINEKKNH